jgi:hypothetical protein
MSERPRDIEWAAPELPFRHYVSADGWTHDRPVDALRFTSTGGRPAILVILDADLELGEAERLMGLVLAKLYGLDEHDGEVPEAA